MRLVLQVFLVGILACFCFGAGTTRSVDLGLKCVVGVVVKLLCCLLSSVGFALWTMFV